MPTAKLVAAPKVPLPVAQQHAHVVAAVVGGDEVGLAVAVEVPDRHGVRTRADGEVCGGAEGAGARPQQHAHDVVVEVGGDEVGLAVAVDVPDRHGERSRGDGEVGGGAEGAVARP